MLKNIKDDMQNVFLPWSFYEPNISLHSGILVPDPIDAPLPVMVQNSGLERLDKIFKHSALKIIGHILLPRIKSNHDLALQNADNG